MLVQKKRLLSLQLFNLNYWKTQKSADEDKIYLKRSKSNTDIKLLNYWSKTIKFFLLLSLE